MGRNGRAIDASEGGHRPRHRITFYFNGLTCMEGGVHKAHRAPHQTRSGEDPQWGIIQDAGADDEER